jgi:hypothetical protein
MSKFTSRVEFLVILSKVVSCLRASLDRPGVSPLTPEQIHFWLQQISIEDIETVVAEIEAQAKNGESVGLPAQLTWACCGVLTSPPKAQSTTIRELYPRRSASQPEKES